MKARRWLLLVSLLAVAVSVATLAGGRSTHADGEVQLARSSAAVGEHFQATFRVLAPSGATVELTPGGPSWAGVELVSIDSVNQVQQPDGVDWLIQATLAGFAPGQVSFAPTVSVVTGSDARTEPLPAVPLRVLSTLPADAPLELSPLPAPVAISGAESPWLKPGIAAGVVAPLALIVAAGWFAVRRLRRRRPQSLPELIPGAPPSLQGAESLLHSDPVMAYRLMSAVVKSTLAERHGVRATALTTRELRHRLELGGERWEARLVAGLLEECDSVIYAGYRPAAERREADLTMAREIIGAAE